MKRSQINAALENAEATLARHGWALPDWAWWKPHQHEEERELSAWLAERQLGWDVTDFGHGDFDRRGLTLFCVRNGIQNVAAERPYAEKLLFVGIDQEAPFHAHAVKVEDIIVRGGGRLAVEFTRDGAIGEPDEVRIDGRTVSALSGPVLLSAGQSVTIPRGLQHRFWGEGEAVFVAEVSQCNDDLNDNFFLEGLGRFSTIEEDEAPTRLLWNEVGKAKCA